MIMRQRSKPLSYTRTVKTPIAVNRATVAGRKPAKPPLTERFHVAVDRQLKSGHGTYEAAEEAASTIKKQHPQLHVTVYDATEQRHAIIERPKNLHPITVVRR